MFVTQHGQGTLEAHRRPVWAQAVDVQAQAAGRLLQAREHVAHAGAPWQDVVVQLRAKDRALRRRHEDQPPPRAPELDRPHLQEQPEVNVRVARDTPGGPQRLLGDVDGAVPPPVQRHQKALQPFQEQPLPVPLVQAREVKREHTRVAQQPPEDELVKEIKASVLCRRFLVAVRQQVRCDVPPQVEPLSRVFAVREKVGKNLAGRTLITL